MDHKGAFILSRSCNLVGLADLREVNAMRHVLIKKYRLPCMKKSLIYKTFCILENIEKSRSRASISSPVVVVVATRSGSTCRRSRRGPAPRTCGRLGSRRQRQWPLWNFMEYNKEVVAQTEMK